MKSTDERISEVLGRAQVREATNRRRRQRVAALGGGALAVAVVAAVGVGMSSLPGAQTASADATLDLMGSVFASGSALGYVVVGLLGLVLGTAVTLVAYRLGHSRNGLVPRVEVEIGAHALSENMSQLAKSPSESACASSPDRPDSGNPDGIEVASNGERGEP